MTVDAADPSVTEPDEAEQAAMLDYVRECSVRAPVVRAHRRLVLSALTGSGLVLCGAAAWLAIADRSWPSAVAAVVAAAASLLARWKTGPVEPPPEAPESATFAVRYEAALARFLHGVDEGEVYVRASRRSSAALSLSTLLLLLDLLR